MVSGPKIEPEARGRDATVKTVERVARILRQLASSGESGARLTDLALALELSKPTLHRLLGALVEAGMARHNAETKCWRLGELSAMLGQSSTRITVATEARQSLIRLAAATQDTVFVSVREGAAAICVGSQTGSFPIRTHTLNVGDQRPLGVGAGSLALLAFLSDAEIEEVVSRNQTWLASYPLFTPRFLRKQVSETRARGYSLNRGQVIPGMSAVGVAAMGSDGRPIAAFSVASISERVVNARERELVALLRAEAEILSSVFPPPPVKKTLAGIRQ